MNRIWKWQYYSGRQRAIAFGVYLGSTATLGTGVWHLRSPSLAEGTLTADLEGVSTKPTATAGRAWHDREKRHSRGQADPDATSNFKGNPSETSESSAWKKANRSICACSDTFSGFDFGVIGSQIAKALIPSWIRTLPGYVDKLRDEFSGAPWSLSWEIWEEAHDPEINQEITWDARVRISKALCPEELTFRQQRQRKTAKALAKYLDVPESDIHPEDVPIIGMCGSGGGLRALVAGASSSLCAQESGLFDCVTYTAGVSGSCWLQTLFNSSLGKHDYGRILDHLKDRINIHIAYPPAALGLLSHAPTNKYLLSGFVEKLRGVPDADLGIVDIYGLLLAARLLVSRHELNVSETDLKISNQRFSIEGGEVPLPIYTAVRHEIPQHLKEHTQPSDLAWHNTKQYDWFQWFEWTPYEFFCEELECGIPTWAVGRRWEGGVNVWRQNGLALPELRVPLMLGIWGSAFCATMSHYYKEIRPVIKAAGLGKLDELLSGKDDDLVKVHPIDPAVIPNFALGLRDRLPSTCPESIHVAQHLQLMDAGMSNNLPIYPLLRPGRDVDVIIAFDASADVKADNWVKAVDGYARQRGIAGWPMGAGWPPQPDGSPKNAQELHDTQAASAESSPDDLEESTSLPLDEQDLGYCNVWVGTVQERQEYMDEPPAKRLTSESDDWQLSADDAGVALIYFPLVKNDKVPGVDPVTSAFMSTWNFIYKPEEIDSVVRLARANYEEGKEQTRRTIRAVWERKKMLRMQREQEQQETQRMYWLRNAEAAMGDHFSGH